MPQLSPSLLNDAFTYDEVTGDLRHKRNTLSGKAGELATYRHSAGYLCVSIRKKQYLAHRIIFIMKMGRESEAIDHINHDKSDNRWSNLREVTQTVNNQNIRKSRNNTTGVTGVSYHRQTKKYRAYIGHNGKAIHLGLFPKMEDAIIARENALKQYGYHPNHGR